MLLNHCPKALIKKILYLFIYFKDSVHSKSPQEGGSLFWAFLTLSTCYVFVFQWMSCQDTLLSLESLIEWLGFGVLHFYFVVQCFMLVFFFFFLVTCLCCMSVVVGVVALEAMSDYIYFESSAAGSSAH